MHWLFVKRKRVYEHGWIVNNGQVIKSQFFLLPLVSQNMPK
jgi:hypothetical protein